MKQEGIMLGEIIKSDTDKIMISLNECKRRKYIDIRTYFHGNNGSYLPTKKGVTFLPKFIDHLIGILMRSKTMNR